MNAPRLTEDSLHTAVLAVNNELIDNATEIRERIAQVLESGSNLEDDVRDFLNRIDDRLKDLVNKTNDINDSI